MSARDRSRSLKSHALSLPVRQASPLSPAERREPGPAICSLCRRSGGEMRQWRASLVHEGGCQS